MNEDVVFGIALVQIATFGFVHGQTFSPFGPKMCENYCTHMSPCSTFSFNPSTSSCQIAKEEKVANRQHLQTRACPANFYHDVDGGICLKSVSNKMSSYKAARNCATRYKGGHLAVLNTIGKLESAKSYIKKYDYFITWSVWIGRPYQHASNTPGSIGWCRGDPHGGRCFYLAKELGYCIDISSCYKILPGFLCQVDIN